jgi:hypothetical protein
MTIINNSIRAFVLRQIEAETSERPDWLNLSDEAQKYLATIRDEDIEIDQSIYSFLDETLTRRDAVYGEFRRREILRLLNSVEP